jgi:hypothetical protein
MLEQLPHLQAVKLGIQAYEGTEEDYDYPSTHAVGWVHHPAMAGVAALTELALIGATSLPPDWCQLSALQCLKVIMDAEVGASRAEFSWGSASLALLTALTRLEVQGLMPGEGRPLGRAPPPAVFLQSL